MGDARDTQGTYLVINHNKVSNIKHMRRENKDELVEGGYDVLSRTASLPLTDSNSVCAELPKMNEKPTMIVASGTSDARVLLRLKMSKQMKIKMMSTTASKTASSFATAEPTS